MNYSSQNLTDCCPDPDERSPRIREILHVKCPIVRLIRCQMRHAEDKFGKTLEWYKKRNTVSFRLWRNRWAILSCVLIVLLMIGLFLYGSLVGAGMCSTGWSYSVNSPCPQTFRFLPFSTARSARTFTY